MIRRTLKSSGRSSRTQRRGAIFVIALAMTVVLSALLVVYAREMSVESIASANRLAAAKADCIEQGAEQWVLAQIEANTTALPTTTGGGGTTGSSSSSTTTVDPTTIPAEAIPVGTGYFWLLNPDPTQDHTYQFGIADESGKLNLNSATATQLQNIPNMTQELATSITTWLQSVNSSSSSGSSSSSSSSSTSTAGPLRYESVEQLLLVDQNLTQQLLYGYDLNHDGVIDQSEQTAAGGAAVTDGVTSDSRGMFNYLTVYSTTAQAGAVGTIAPTITRGRNGATVSPQTIGLININTAPLQVLECLPGLTQSDATTLISYRTSQQPTGTKWVAQALTQNKASAIAPYITGVSYQYSADIVAVTGDARAFKRVRIVVDCRVQPAKIVYRRDLTSLGWPLPPEVRDSMRAGKGVPASVSGTTNQQTNGGATQ
jgi:DNA uptake protein ComE-like DNA-binding protein